MHPGLLDMMKRIDGCLLADRRRLMGRLHAADRALRGGEVGVEARVASEVAEAESRVAARRSRIPRPSYPSDLPVCQKREDMARAIERHQVVVVCGETGSGKTTQLPKICLELGRGVRGMIGHTQPRRIAARAVAGRIAEELGTPLGDVVGYKVRFGDHTSPGTIIKVMTDGILLAETQGDRSLERYDTLIIDEAHERSLNIDFLLGYIKTLLPRRPDLKVIITSATIDPERFARHFAKAGIGGSEGEPAPIVQVSGRTYPVEVIYRPPHSEDLDERDEEMQHAIITAVDECASYGEGDILLFLSGEREIRETAESLAKHHVPGAPGTAILPLYAKLSAEEQQKAFRPHTGRRIVLATNVAETSLTVPGIVFVIDPGMARVSRYNPRTKVQRLEVEPVSRASADQRKGRCGRICPGICVRLYSREDYEARPEFTLPEILRTNLASVILQMISLKLGDIDQFPFLEPPDSRAVADGYDTLFELGAIDASRQLTPLGAQLAKLPIDPRIGRLLLAGEKEKCLSEALTIASALSVQDPRDRPMDAADRADQAHAEFRDAGSDFLSYLKLWGAWRENRRHLSGSRLRRWCKEHFLSFVRMREWEDIHHQLGELMGSLGHRANTRPSTPEAVHRAILTGLLTNVGLKGETGEYTGARGTKFSIFPGSALFKSGAKWVVAAEIVLTSKLYARTVAPINPEWIEELGAHLVKRTYSEPHWSRQAGRVIANERVAFMGLEVVPRRRVHFGPIDPVASREIFIHHALVEGDMDTRAPFMAHNRGIEAEVRDMEVRSRRQNLLADITQRHRFYDSQVPREILTAGAFERWRHAATKANPRLLFMTRKDLLAPGVPEPTREMFPDEIDAGPVVLPLMYRFESGHEADGVTVRVPVETLGQLSPERFAWLVPGHVREKIETIVRGLGKEWRRVLPPAGALGAKCAEGLRFGDGVLIDKVRERIREAARVDVPREVLAAVPLPPHLLMRFEVIGEDGRVLTSGRDLGQIKSALAPQLRGGLLKSETRFARDNIRAWDFGDLPERIEIDRFGVSVVAYPGIADQKTSVSLRLYDAFDAAMIATRAGTRRLFMFEAAEELRRHTSYLPGVERMQVQYATLGSAAQCRAQLQELIADRAFIGDQLPVRTEKEFAFRVGIGIDRLGAAQAEVVPLAASILALYQAVQSQIAGARSPAWQAPMNDIRDQVARLVPPDFMTVTPWAWLRHLPRFLQAVQLRIQKLAGSGLARDVKLMAEVEPLWKGYEDLVARQKELGLSESRIAEYRWMVEELRVSLFAQELRTSVPVSVKRLQRQWEEVVRG